MRDPLKEYVDQHRTELDVAVPSDKLWTNIETAMITAVPAAGITSGISWLKYFAFGLSSVAGAAVVYTVVTNTPAPSEEITSLAPPAKTIQVSNAPLLPVEPASATEFILMNAAAPLPPPPPPAEAAAVTALTAVVAEDTTVELQTAAVLPVTALSNDSVFTGIRRVEIVASSATVRVNGTNSREVSTTSSQLAEAQMKVSFTRKDTVLTISLEEDDAGRKKDCGGKTFKVNAGMKSWVPELTVNVPTGTSVVIQNTYGDTKVSNVTGALCTIRSSAGDVFLASVNAATNVSTSYGDLDVRDITGDFTARLSSGSVTVKQVKGNVDVAATYGDQDYSGVTGNIKANGSSGDIRVNNLRGDITAATSYGDIHINDFKGGARLTSSSGSIFGDNIELTSNSTFVTTYGDVKMTLINPLQALSFDLATTYGDILVEKNGEEFRNDSKLTLTRGAILVKATSSSGDQVFR